jgi:hypothetical protein
MLRTKANAQRAEIPAATLWHTTYINTMSPSVYADALAEANPPKRSLNPGAIEFKPLAMGTNALAKFCINSCKKEDVL